MQTPSDITIYNEPCECPEDTCFMFVEPQSECVNHLTGEVVTKFCEKCGSTTWHQDNNCLRCRKLKITPE